MTSDPLQILEESATVLPAESWMLVGGLMVHCHAAKAGLAHPRITTDVDIIVQISTLS